MPEIRMNSLKSLAMNLRPVVGNDPRPSLRKSLFGPLQDDLDVRLSHRLPQIPVDDVSATAIENAAQVIERPADIDVRHVNVPVLMSGQWLLEARALLRRLAVPLRQ